MGLTLSERGSLIVPVPHDRLPIPTELTVEGERLVRKAEHHMTVLGYAVGKKIRQAQKARPDLAPAIQALIDGASFDFRMTDRLVHLTQPTLRTVVVLVEAPGIEAFFGAMAELLDVGGTPPPHITLYTSDPEGKAGIGLNTVADLKAALERDEPNPLRARPLPPGLLAL